MSYQPGYQPAASYAQSFLGHPQDPNVGLPPGWIARWDQNSQHWYYVDTSTGRSQWERPMPQSYAPQPPVQQQAPQVQQPPQSGYYPAGGSGESHGSGSGGHGGHGGHGDSGNYDDHYDGKGYHKNWANHQETYLPEPHHPKPASSPKPPKKHHNWLGYAAAGALGIGAGGLLVHEGHEVAEDLEEFKDDLQNAPKNAAGWVGGKVGEVEEFGDEVEGAYKKGKYEGKHEHNDNDESGSGSGSGSSSSSSDNDDEDGEGDNSDDSNDGGDGEDSDEGEDSDDGGDDDDDDE